MALVLPGNARTLRFTGESKSLAPPSREPSSREPSREPSGELALGKPRVRKPPEPTPSAQRIPPPPKRKPPEPTPSARLIPPPEPTPSAQRIPPPPKRKPPEPTPSAQRIPPPPERKPPEPTPSAQRIPPPPERKPPEPTPSAQRIPPPPERKPPTLNARLMSPPPERFQAPYAASYPNVYSRPAARASVHDESVDDEIATRAMERDALPLGVAQMPRPVSLAPIPHFRAASAVPAIVRHTASTTVTGAPLAVWLVAAVLVGVISYFVVPDLMARVETTSATSRR